MITNLTQKRWVKTRNSYKSSSAILRQTARVICERQITQRRDKEERSNHWLMTWADCPMQERSFCDKMIYYLSVLWQICIFDDCIDVFLLKMHIIVKTFLSPYKNQSHTIKKHQSSLKYSVNIISLSKYLTVTRLRMLLLSFAQV